MPPILDFSVSDWKAPFSDETRQEAMNGIETGNVLLFPQLPFVLEGNEKRFLTPDTVGKSKNVSYDINTGVLRGTSLEGQDAEQLKGMIHRFASVSRDLVFRLLPHYQKAIVCGRTSYRPVEIKGRASSWRKDDTRLHVDAFPSAPVQDKRLLRVFSNVNPNGDARVWRVGGAFEDIAKRFMPNIPGPVFGSSQLLQWLHITKSRRSAYDHFMLQLHDSMKADPDYQAKGEQITFNFQPGTTWMVFTDQVPHAVMSGQYLLEQTFYLPVSAMADPARSPLQVLERMTERSLT
jgi:hypothetical protein